MEKGNPNLITIYSCFVKSGLKFTRHDTNNIGLAFMGEIRKHNPNYKAIKIQQKERNQVFTVNAFPKEFEPLIMSLIEEYRVKNNLEYRPKPSPGQKRPFNQRKGGYQPHRRRDGGGQGGYDSRRGHDKNRPQNRYSDRDGRRDGPRPGGFRRDRPDGTRPDNRPPRDDDK